MTTTKTPVLDWVAEGTRPAGQPGTVNRHGFAWSYPAVQLTDGRVFYWRDSTESAGRWIEAPARLADSFEAGPEWLVRCVHAHGGVPYRWCTDESGCVALQRADERTWGDR